MERFKEYLDDGIYRITEETGEVHYTALERPMEDGYRLFQYVAYPILTQDEIDTVQLPPSFDVDSYKVYPEESETLFPYLIQSHSLTGRSIIERIARIRIQENLDKIANEEN